MGTNKTLSGTVNLIGVACLLVAFVIGRWGIWKYFPNPLVYTDSIKYLDIAERISSGHLPSFHHIGAGYPIFIWFFKSVGDQLFTVVFAQQLLSLLSVLLLLFVFRKNLLTAGAAVLVGLLHILSDNVIKYEIWIFPDSLITSLNLIWCSLAYHGVQNKSMPSTILAGLIGAISIILRSSSVFFIPLTLVLCAWFLANKNKRIAVAGFVAFLLPLLLTSTYNYQWSIGNKFSFLTYDRLESQEELQSERHEIAPKTLTKPDAFSVKNLILQLPDSAEIKKYYFSWNLEELTKAVINCRMGRVATRVDNKHITFCCRGDMNSHLCNDLALNDDVYSDSLVREINNYLQQNKTEYKTLKYFLAYHANLELVYGQTYYSTIHHAFETTVADANPSIYSVVPDQRVPELKSYILNATRKQPTETFDGTYNNLLNDPVFKLYDLTTNHLMKPVYRNSFWLFAFFASSILIIIRFFSSNNKKQYFGLSLTTAMSIGGALVFAIFSNPLPRYSFEIEFSYTLVSLIGIAFLLSSRKQIDDGKL